MTAVDRNLLHASRRDQGGVAMRFFSAILNWNERRITRNELMKLSDRELEDIGLSREDISSIVR